MKRTSFVAATALAFATAAAHADQGPSSSATAYLVPAGDASFTSVLTVGDSVKKSHKGNEQYRMVGIPDGLGAFDNGDGTFTVLMNHELGTTSGIARDHGAAGAFVSSWQVRKSDLKVLRGGDLIQTVMLWDVATQQYRPAAAASFNRFCSADLARPSAFFNSKTGLGFSDGRLYLNGEEAGPSGRAFAHVAAGRAHGTSFELAAIGRMSFENVVANPYEQDRTVVVSTDDSTPGSVYVYAGMKQDEGNPVEMAGLTNGVSYAIAVAGVPAESRDAGIAAGTRFALVAPTDAAATKFLRPEDGAWDTQNPNRFYFVTTDRYDQAKDGVGANSARSRLWRLTFDSIEAPEAGGSIEMMLDGSEAGNMFDNMAVDGDGRVVIQEDVGNQQHNGKIWRYDPSTDALSLLGKHDPARFGELGVPAAAGFNQDEESSGVVDVTDLLAGTEGYDAAANRYYLFDVQAHIGAGDPELVEKGQLLLMRAPR